MNWMIAHAGGAKCGACSTPIGQGEPYATVGSVNLKRCAACLKQRFDAEPPPELWAQQPETDTLPDVIREAQARMTTKAGETRDGKAAQMGDDQ